MTIDELIAEVWAELGHRPGPTELAGLAAAGALIVDIRPLEQRSRDGELPGAVVVDRNVLEWRLDPRSDFRIPEVTTHERPVVLVCHEGYASALAALTLRCIGLVNTTDLDGGYLAWLALHA